MTRYGSILIELVFGFFIVVLLMRLLLSPLPKAKYTVIGSLITRVSDWLVAPFNWLPKIAGYATAPLVVAYLLIVVAEIVLLTLQGTKFFSQPVIALTIIGAKAGLQLLHRLVQLYLFVIIGGALCTFFPMQDSNLRMTIVELYTRYMQPYRRLVPKLNQVDISPLVAFLVAQILMLVLFDLQNMVGGILA